MFSSVEFVGFRFPLSRFIMIAACLATACTGGGGQPGFEQSAAADIARHPAWYSNGDARGFLVSQGGHARGLLWGTIHVAYGEDTVMPVSIRHDFDDASDLTVEFAFDRMSLLDKKIFLDSARMAILMPDPMALAALDPATRAAVDALPADRVGRLSLLGMRYALSAQSQAMPSGPLPQFGFVDLNLIQFARQRDIPVLGLERPAVQEDILFSEPNGADAAAGLRQLVRQRDTIGAMTSFVKNAYGQGSVAIMVATLDGWQADEDDPTRRDRYRRRFLTDRNAAWAQRLDARFTLPGFHFAAFGAAHLLGDDGVVALLRQKGWTVLPCPGDVCPALVRS